MTNEEEEPRPEAWFEDGKCHILYKMGLFPARTHTDEDGNEYVVENDPSVFFPEKGESTREAKSICLGTDGRPPCRILDRCREYAVQYERFGIWGGMSERERSNMRRSLQRRARLEGKRVVRRPVDLPLEWPAREA